MTLKYQTLPELPEDIWRSIFDCLDLRLRLQLSVVCKSWHQQVKVISKIDYEEEPEDGDSFYNWFGSEAVETSLVELKLRTWDDDWTLGKVS